MLTMSVELISCSKKDGEINKQLDSQVNLNEKETILDEEDNYNTDFGEDATLLPRNEAVKERNTYICYDMKDTTLELYYDSLVEQGYQLLLEETVGGYTYDYFTNGENRIQVVHIENSTLVSIVRNYKSMEKEEEVISTAQALELIKNKDKVIGFEEQAGEEQLSINVVSVVVKHWIRDLYEKANILAYSAYTKEGKNAGTYLIYDNKAYQIYDDLSETCVSDLDHNGAYELLTLYGYGFGTYRINLNVYQYGNPISYSSLNKVLHLNYRNSFVPEQTYGCLRFKKVSDSEIHLIEIEEKTTEEQTKEKSKEIELQDYGALTIAEDNIHIIPEKITKFPYYQWDYDFTRPTSDSETTSEEVLKELPQLEVSVGDIKLNYVGSKIDWNGEKEEDVVFSDIMNDTIPVFEYPNISRSYTEDICLSFKDAQPTKITVQDYLLTEGGGLMYQSDGVIERDIRYGNDGKYYIDLVQHMALFFSSSSYTYTNPSYRGFRITCEFGENQICEYAFVLSVAPQMEEY